VAAGLLLASAVTVGKAEARGFVAFSFGVPLMGPAYYPPPSYYPPAPAYYYPPPVPTYVPPPAYYPPATAAAPASGQTCREYQATATIDGRAQPTYGTACLQPDGTWRIVR
jgi:hypothetical protein